MDIKRNLRLLRGENSLAGIHILMSQFNIKRPLIIGSETTVGALMRKKPSLLSCPVFHGYHPNPDLYDAEKAADIFRQQECDSLISIGGGSAIDTAKAAKAVLGTGSALAAAHKLPEHLPDIRHIAIPGTAGSGAEATPFAVCYLDGCKISLSHPELQPDAVILDASLLETLPEYHRKSCALDALSQGIESFWAKGATSDSKVHAYLAILGVLDNLRSYLDGDLHAAQEMLEASYQSGKAIRISRTTAAHAMSYQMTMTLGIAHGHACMLTLPELWEMMLDDESMKDTLAELSALMRLGSPLMGPRLLRGILYALQMDIHPALDDRAISEMSSRVNPDRLHNHPVSLTDADIRMIYRKAFAVRPENEKQACLDIWQFYGRDT